MQAVVFKSKLELSVPDRPPKLLYDAHHETAPLRAVMLSAAILLEDVMLKLSGNVIV